VEAIDREWRVRWDLTDSYYRRPPKPADDPRFGKDPLDKHIGLLKHESSILIQIRTGKIGFNAFLHRRRVPGVQPECYCGAVPEIALHLTTSCNETKESRSVLAVLIGSIDTLRDFADVV